MLKAWPDLAFAALRGKCDRAYRLWTLARALDTRGSGCVRMADLRTFLDAHQVHGLAPGTLRRLVKRGDGVFWTAYRRDSTRNGERWLQLRGLAAVCVALGVGKLRKTPVRIPLRLARTLRGFRAGLLAGFFAGDEFSRPISRRSLEVLTGASPRTQRRWQRLVCQTLESQQNAAPTTDPWERGDAVPEGHFVDLVGDQVVLLKRLPNSYRSKLPNAARGMARRVNGQLNARDDSIRIRGMETRKRDRLFYYKRQGAQRRIQACDEGDLFYLAGAEVRGRPATTARGGTFLWTRMRIADGGLYCG